MGETFDQISESIDASETGSMIAGVSASTSNCISRCSYKAARNMVSKSAIFICIEMIMNLNDNNLIVS